MNSNPRNTLIWITLFAIAMGLLETVVVIYLRELYYPEGFAFPLKLIRQPVLLAELLRELATLVMLLTVGIIAGRTVTRSFAWFIYAFAIWDIFYYIFLKLLTGWPESLLTWDLLFLLPVTWVGPVIAPLINCTVMVALAAIILFNNRANTALHVYEWMLLTAGALVIILAYTLDYSAYMMNRFTLKELFNRQLSETVMEQALQYVPHKFNWWIFLVGVVMHLFAIVLYLRRKTATNIAI